MRERNGILFIPLSYNGDSMLNILNVVFSEKSCEMYNMPMIDKVTFLVAADSPEKIRLQGQEYDSDTACNMLCRSLGEKCYEIRKSLVKNYARDIPMIIMSAVREVGRDRLIIDLTCGKKDITGSLYTSASISQIANMIYVEVNRDSEGRFYQLDKDDVDLTEKFKLTKYESLDEIERLASLNCMDFIFYKKNIQDMNESASSAKVESYCSQINHVVEEYFSEKKEDYKNAIREVGLINEEMMSALGKYLLEHYKAYLSEAKSWRSMDVIRTLEAKYQSKEIDAKSKQDLDRFFGKNPVIFEMLEILRIYRNRASHNHHLDFTREEVKLVLDILLQIMNNLSAAGILEEVMGDKDFE